MEKILKKNRKKIDIFFDIYEKSLIVAKKLRADGVKISAADSFNNELIRDCS